MAAAAAPAPDWLRLQRKIFSRWVKLKVAKRNVVVNDIVTDVSDGIVLLNLVEVLSEKKFTEKYTKEAKLRPQKLDNASNVLKFVWSCGVEMKLKPSPEDLVDGNEKNILGLIWAIMLKYIKIGDEDDGEQLNAKDALLLWLQNKTSSYGLKIEKFGKELHDGMVLCALIHKHRPKLVNFSSLKSENKITNLQTAIDAAEKYFGLEKYLTPEDIPKLDENSMVIYISEYYYGIAEQMKLDLAARRISKVIKLTEENDALKAEFNKTGQRFLDTLKKVEKVLEDRSIDNTMAGAKRRLEEFYNYKTVDKNSIIGDQLNLEAIYNTLAMKLSHNKRPEYIPPKGLTLKDMEAALHHLEECEQERSVALHAELNRQIKLVQLDEQHKYRYNLLASWITEKDAYLKKKEHIESVSSAQLHLRLLDAYDKESAAIFAGSVDQLLKLGKNLIEEKYERSAEVKKRDDHVSESFKQLGELSQAKRPVLDDDLAREQFKEKVRLMNNQHIKRFEVIESWINEKEAYLRTKESIHSVAEARTQLSLLDTYEKDKVSVTTNLVAQLKKLGAEILAKKYETKYSSWSLEEPEKLKGRESKVDAKWQELSELSAEKKRVLDDHLAREEFKDKVLLMNANHVAKYKELQAWVAEKENYLNTKEQINSVSEAQTQLSILEEYEKEKQTVTETNVASLKTLGADILAQKYETKYSKYVFENPNEVKDRESNVDSKWNSLSQLSASKNKVLEADLAREIEKERLRLEFAHLASEFTRWTKDTSDNAKVTHFGFNLDEVQAFQAVLNKSDSDTNSQAASRKTEYTNVWNQMKTLGVTENIYTTLTPDDLAKSQSVMDAAIKKRKEDYDAELKRQLANDALCKQFASLADPFSKWIIEQKDSISQSKKDLEEQLKFVDQRFNGLAKDGAKLPEIQSIDGKMKDAGITNNRHTTLTLKDLEVQWEQYQAFLKGKQKMLREEIENAKLRGITPEQFKDIEDNFKQFDKDKSLSIDRKELKACLYSLGEEKTATEVTEIIKKFGKDGRLPYEGFREFMIGVLGDANTKEEIVEGFQLINKGAEFAVVEKLELVMNDHDVFYFKNTAPPQGTGYNYKAWTEDVFSR